MQPQILQFIRAVCQISGARGIAGVCVDRRGQGNSAFRLILRVALPYTLRPMIPPHAILCAAAFFLAFGNTLAFHATPFYAFDHLAGDARLAGTFGAVQAVFYTVTSLLSSRIVARFHRGLDLAMIGTAVFAVTYGAVPFLTTPWVCVISSSLGLLGMALTWPAIHSWVGAEPNPVERAKHMSWINMSWSSGAAISPLFSGPLYDYDFRLPFLGSVGMCVLVVLLVRSMPHEHAHFSAPSQEMLDARADHDRAAAIFLWPAWIGIFVFNALGGALKFIYPKRIDELVVAGELRWLFETDAAAILTRNPATIFSVLAFAFSLGTAVAFFVMGKTSGWKHRFGTLLWPQLLAMAALLVLGTTQSLLLMTLAFAAVGAGLGICFFNGSYCSLSDPTQKHRRAAVTEGMVGGGSLLGTFAFGQLAVLGTAVPFFFSPVGIAILLGVQAMALRRARRG